MQWEKAKEEVLRVQSRRNDEIQRRWKRFAVGIWIPTFIGGCLGTAWGLAGAMRDPLGFSMSTLAHSDYALAVFGGGILALGGSLMALFGRGKGRESNFDKSVSH
jgi:hypothetical protein